MAEFNDIYQKAGLLMTSALKKYNEGDIEGGDRDREEANKLYNSAEQEVNADQEKTAMLYGENRNFGIAYKVFESNADKIFSTKEGKKKIGALLKMLKEDKNLLKQFNAYKLLAFTENISDASSYVNEAVSMIRNFDKKQIVESNEKFIKRMRKMGLDELIDIPEDELKLYESVEYVMLNKRKPSNINEYVNAKNTIVEYIEKNSKKKQQSVDKNESIDDIYNKGLEEIQEKYDSLLNDDEKKLIEMVSKSEDKEGLFEEKKNEALKMLKESLDYCGNEKTDEINQIIESVESRDYDEDNVLSDVAEFIEIANTLSPY